MTIEEFCRRAITVPFKIKGRDWNGWDCWGMLCKGYEEINNVLLPQYNGQYRSVKELELLAKLFKEGIVSGGWKPVKKAQAMDGIMYYMQGRGMHVGMAINKRKMLHVAHGINTCIQNINSFRIEGIYRHNELISKKK